MCDFKGLGEVVEDSTAEIQIRIMSQAGIWGADPVCERAAAPLLVLSSDLGFTLRSCVALASLFLPLYLSFLIRKMACGSHTLQRMAFSSSCLHQLSEMGTPTNTTNSQLPREDLQTSLRVSPSPQTPPWL